jgi:glutathione synthase/RimK-type ligase-like ATP-grasp enzyme
MARKHWQIYDRSSSGKTYSGRSETVAISGTNKSVIKTAVKTASLIGDGLYGVDLKEVDGIIYVIEVNDNPSIDFGYEDEILKDELYKSVMNEILNRIEIRKGAK